MSLLVLFELRRCKFGGVWLSKGEPWSCLGVGVAMATGRGGWGIAGPINPAGPGLFHV